jgi:TPR repeat protein
MFLTKSRLKNLCENVLSEERFLALYPPPVDPIKQKAEVRAQFQSAVASLAGAAKNNSSSHSDELRDLTSWTLEDVASGELSVNQLMNLAKLRFTGGGDSGGSSSSGGAPTASPTSSSPEHKDPELAVAAWVQASKQGNTDAAYSVAFCLLNGIGIKQDEEEAFLLMLPLAGSYGNAYAHVRDPQLTDFLLLPVCVSVCLSVCSFI